MKLISPQNYFKKNFPTIIVVLGATGDLMSRKIVPALFNLYLKQKLPKMTRVIGFSRRQIGQQEFKEMIADMIRKQTLEQSESVTDNFVKLFSYHRGDFGDTEQYEKLSEKLGKIDGQWKTCANKLFYLAVPPQYYENIFHRLDETGLTEPCSPEEGWTRVLVEKPFGKDAETAQKLDILLSSLFREEQIYRIDHYLAKEMLQNVLTFRFANNLFEKSWDKNSIEKVEIRLWETLGVEKRGKFYDGVGALRDVGQNHLLQMLAIVTMDQPESFRAQSIREKRADILSSLLAPGPDEIKELTFRSQYKGYRGIKNVNPRSNTETYFKIRLNLETNRWRGVPFILESGKRMAAACKEIVIVFKNPNDCLCPAPLRHIQNKVVFRLEPKEEIVVSFFAKKPGLDYFVEERKFDFAFRTGEKKQQYVEEYEKLLLDAIIGDQTLFVSTKEVKEMWRTIDPVVVAWQKNEIGLKSYKPDTNGSVADSNFIDLAKNKSFLKKEIGMVGLGKMGANLSRQLLGKDWRVVGYNRSAAVTENMAAEGLVTAFSLKELIEKLKKPRVVWVMLPSGEVIDDMIVGKNGLMNLLEAGDIIVDGSNSFYRDTLKRYRAVGKKGIGYLDVGVSGGPAGALNGAALMVGGSKMLFEELKQLFLDLAVDQGVEYVGRAGAGHFVKMVHNGIEYAVMQAIAEGFTVLKAADYRLDLEKIADIYNHGSVIESRLINWLKQALAKHGQDLDGVTSTVAQTGEGLWTLETAKKMNLETKVIEDSVIFRKESAKKPSYTGRILSALREQFGGHKA